jgi:sulfate/thiosulfate transport system substrate-binding protein
MTFSPRHLLAVLALSAASLAQAQTTNLLNVSYDVAREFYKDLNTCLCGELQKTTGKDIKVDQSHAGSSAQARAVSDGLDADVVTMNTTTDVDFLADKGLVDKEWRKRFAGNAAPTSSTMLFLVRNGNPKGVRDWDDLIKPGMQVVVVNPKTGGNGRMAYLAAWGYVRSKGGTDAQAAEFVAKLYKNVPVLARGGRDATGIFLQRNIGDVLVTFESEVVSVDNEFGAGKVDAIHPSASIVADNPVAIVERTVKKKNTAEQAKAYIDFIYSPEGQEIAAKHNIRPRNEAVLKKYASAFKPIKLFTVDQYFGSMAEAQKVHFNDGGQFDKLYTTRCHEHPLQGVARLQADAGLHPFLPQPGGAHSAGGAGLENLHADLAPVLGGRDGAARAGLVPADLWRVFDRRAGERVFWPLGGLGAGALHLPGQKNSGRAGGPALCPAHGRGRHFTERAAGWQRLGGPIL